MPEANFDPYHKWLGVPPEEQPPNHYRLLGIQMFESDPDVIESAATRQITHVRSFAIGKHGEFSQAILNELAAAKLCLLLPARKREYDISLNKPHAGAQAVETVHCPACDASLAINKTLYGKLVKCPKCSATCQISVDGKEASEESGVNGSEGNSLFDALPKPEMQASARTFTGVAGPKRKSTKGSRNGKSALKWIVVVAVPTGAICGIALAALLLWVLFKKDPLGIMVADTNVQQPNRIASTPIKPTDKKVPLLSSVNSIGGNASSSSGLKQGTEPSPPAAVAPFDAVTAKEHQHSWIHESLIAQFDLDNGDLRNVVSGCVGHWRDGDRAKGRWVSSFKRIPTHKTIPDRFGNPIGAVSGLFGLDRQYSLKTFTIAVWFRWIEDHPTDQYQVLIGKCAKEHLHNCNYMLSVANLGAGENGGSLQGTVSGGAGKESGLSSGALQVTDKQWHHAVLVCDYKLSEISLYLDGKQVDNTKLIDGVDTSEAHAFVGFWRGYNWCYGIFTGDLDDLRIYNAPLTNTQVAKLFAYESTTPPAPMPSIAPLSTIEQAVMHQRAWADHLDVPVVSTNSIGMKFAVIPPGEAAMGLPEHATGRTDDETLHRVTLRQPFQMGVHEVTQEQYRKVMRTSPSTSNGPDNPVQQVSWINAAEFCRRLSSLPAEVASGRVYRLPTEAEWEYACRAGTDTAYSFGDSDAEFRDYAWFVSSSNGTVHPVGLKKPNRWGLYDMHGNVSEWCQDWYGAYPDRAVTDPTGAGTGSLRVYRGGGCLDYAVNCQSARRKRRNPSDRLDDLGFRVVQISLGK